MNQEDLLVQASQFGWRVSPLATATTFSALDGDRPRFQGAPHLKLVSDAIVEGVNRTGKQFIIISMPPRFGKSTLVSRWTPEWFLGNNPELTVGMCGYGSSFASSWGRAVRNQLVRHQSRLGFSLAEDSQKANWWHTSKGGGMWTAGIRGEITGKGADLMIIDDPIKSDEEAFSPVYRQSLWEWWMTTALSRTYPHSVIVVVMTRWHTDDFVGRLLSPEYPGDASEWRVIELPAIWDKDYPDEIGRKRGDGLWIGGGPNKFTAEWLDTRRKMMSEESWLSLYQQKPLNRTGLGAVYHNFDENIHVGEVNRDDRLPLSWSLDFNVNPMSAVIAQVKEERSAITHLTNEKLITVEVLDEIVLPNSNTPEMCREFGERYERMRKGRKIEVNVYGDATANRRDTRGSDSDWEIVYRFLRDHGIPFKSHVTKSDPLQRDRVAAMNAALKMPDGIVCMKIDTRCKELRLDMREVRWKKDSAGNTTSQLDKSDPKRTHVSDALGYLVYPRFVMYAGHGREISDSIR